jgi:hypothetical protein
VTFLACPYTSRSYIYIEINVGFFTLFRSDIPAVDYRKIDKKINVRILLIMYNSSLPLICRVSELMGSFLVGHR